MEHSSAALSMEDLSPINAYRRPSPTSALRRLQQRTTEAEQLASSSRRGGGGGGGGGINISRRYEDDIESKSSSPANVVRRMGLHSPSSTKTVDTTKNNVSTAAGILGVEDDGGSGDDEFADVASPTYYSSEAYFRRTGVDDVIKSARSNLVRSVNSRLDLLSSKHAVNLSNQVSQLQKRLKTSYACLREAESARDGSERKARDLAHEVGELHEELKVQALRIAATQRTAVLIKERATAMGIMVRAFHGWSRAARSQATKRKSLLTRLAAIHELHAIAVQRRAFDAWGEVVNLVDLDEHHEERTKRLRSCLLRLWVRGGQAHRKARTARAFARWKGSSHSIGVKAVHAQALLRIVRSTFRVDTVAQRRASVSRAFAKWSRMTYSGGFEAMRAAARLMVMRLHSRARRALRRGFDALRLASTEEAVRVEYQSRMDFLRLKMLHREREIVGAGALSTSLASNHAACTGLAFRRWTAAVHSERLHDASQAAERDRHFQTMQMEQLAAQAGAAVRNDKLRIVHRIVGAFMNRRVGSAFRKWAASCFAIARDHAQHSFGVRLVVTIFTRYEGRRLARSFARWRQVLEHEASVHSGLRSISYLLARSERDSLRGRLRRWYAIAQQLRYQSEAERGATLHAAEAAKKEAEHVAAEAQQHRMRQIGRVVALMDRRCRLDTQRALFRLRQNVASARHFGTRRDSAARRCANHLSQLYTGRLRQAFHQWHAAVGEVAKAQGMAVETLTRLFGAAARSARDTERLAFFRWRSQAKALAAVEQSKGVAARLAQRVVRRMLQRKLAAAFGAWRLVAAQECAVKGGLHKVAYLFARADRDILRARFHRWQLQTRDIAQQEKDLRQAAQDAALAEADVISRERAHQERCIQRVVVLMDRRCRLDAQRAWFRLRSHAVMLRGVDGRRHHALHRCVRRMQHHGVELQRQAFKKWCALAASARQQEHHAADVLRGLMSLAAGSSRDNLRLAFDRWHSSTAAAIAVEGKLHSGIRLTRSLLRKWQAGQIARAFHGWRRAAHEIATSTGKVSAGLAVARGLIRRWESGRLGRAFHAWRRQSDAGAVAQVDVQVRRGIIAARLAELVAVNLRIAWVRWSTKTRQAAEAVHRHQMFTARQVLFRKQVLRSSLRGWATYARDRVAVKRLLRKWLVARPVRRLFHRWRVVADRRHSAVLRLAGLARILQARASRSCLSALSHWRRAAAVIRMEDAAAIEQDERRRRFVLSVLARGREALVLPAWNRWKVFVARQVSATALAGTAAQVRDMRRRQLVLDVLVRSREALLRPAWVRWKHAVSATAVAAEYRGRLRTLAGRLAGISTSFANEGKWTGMRLHALGRRAALGLVLSGWKTLLNRKARGTRTALEGELQQLQGEVVSLEFHAGRMARRVMLEQGLSRLKSVRWRAAVSEGNESIQAMEKRVHRAESAARTSAATAAAVQVASKTEKASLQAAARELQANLHRRLDEFEEARVDGERNLTRRIFAEAVGRGFRALLERRLRWALRRWHSETFLRVVQQRSAARSDRDGLMAFVRQLGEDMAATDGPHDAWGPGLLLNDRAPPPLRASSFDDHDHNRSGLGGGPPDDVDGYAHTDRHHSPSRDLHASPSSSSSSSSPPSNRARSRGGGNRSGPAYSSSNSNSGGGAERSMDPVLAFMRDLRDDMSATAAGSTVGRVSPVPTAAAAVAARVARRLHHQSSEVRAPSSSGVRPQMSASLRHNERPPPTAVQHLLEWDKAVQRHGGAAAFLPVATARQPVERGSNNVPTEVSLVHSPPYVPTTQQEHGQHRHRRQARSASRPHEQQEPNPLDILDDIDDDMARLLGGAEEHQRDLRLHLGDLRSSYSANGLQQHQHHRHGHLLSAQEASASVSGAVRSTAASRRADGGRTTTTTTTSSSSRSLAAKEAFSNEVD